MKKTKYVDASIQALKQMLGDETNELGSVGKRTLSRAVGELKRLKRHPEATYDDVSRTVAEVAELVLKANGSTSGSEFRS